MASAGAQAVRGTGRVAAGQATTRPNGGVAVIAITIAGGVLFYDLSRQQLTDQQKLGSALSFGVGAVILVALAEALPEIGVPLSVLLMLTVLIGRPKAIDFVSGILSRSQAAAASGGVKSGVKSVGPGAGAPAGPVGPISP